jgi:hypothetical protein
MTKASVALGHCFRLPSNLDIKVARSAVAPTEPPAINLPPPGTARRWSLRPAAARGSRSGPMLRRRPPSPCAQSDDDARKVSFREVLDVLPLGFATDLEAAKLLVREIGVAGVPGSSFFREPERRYVRFHFAKQEQTRRAARERRARLRLGR